MRGFEEVIGQPGAVRFLSRALLTGRLAPTLLFHGPPCVGKETAALALARWLLCERGGGCGQCASCRQVATYQHPDLVYIFPCPASWYEDQEQRGTVLAHRPQHRLGDPLPDPNLTISIEAVRTMTRAAARSPYAGRSVVFVVRAAERLTEEAQNAFLKLLEDVPAHVHIVLMTTNPERLLPTVRSRACAVRFGPLSLQDWITVARRLKPMDESTAESLYRLSGGSLAKAVALWEDGQPRALVRMLFTGSGLSGAWTRTAAERLGGRLDREDLDRLMEYALVWVRDALVWRLTREGRLLANQDAQEEVAATASLAPVHTLLSVLEEMESLRRASRLNLDPRLVCHRMERLAARLRGEGAEG